METLINTSDTTSLREIQREMELYGECGHVSLACLSNHVRSKLPSNKKYSPKKVSKMAQERLTDDKRIYTQLYLDHVSATDPRTEKYFDEVGSRLPGAGLRNYRFSPVGEPCVDIQRYMARPNVTINFLAGVDGIKYHNLLNGATNTI